MLTGRRALNVPPYLPLYKQMREIMNHLINDQAANTGANTFNTSKMALSSQRSRFHKVEQQSGTTDHQSIHEKLHAPALKRMSRWKF